MTRDFLLWFAGFYDGEGWSTFRDRRTGRHFILGVGQAGERGRLILEEILLETGIGRIRKVRQRGNYQQFYDWRVTMVRDVIWIAERLLPLLRVKGAQLQEKLTAAQTELPTMRHSHWTAREIGYIREHFAAATLAELSIELGRSPKAIDGKLGSLGLGKRRLLWAAR